MHLWTTRSITKIGAERGGDLIIRVITRRWSSKGWKKSELNGVKEQERCERRRKWRRRRANSVTSSHAAAGSPRQPHGAAEERHVDSTAEIRVRRGEVGVNPVVGREEIEGWGIMLETVRRARRPV
eukprot:758249-Hanusia_phi.AAC.3